MWRNRWVVIFRHQSIDRVGLSRRDHRLGHEVRDWLAQDFGARLADGPHEIALRHDAHDLVVVSQDDNAANAMLREELCDFKQRTICNSGDDSTTLGLQNPWTSKWSRHSSFPPAAGTLTGR
jgi:hypothetical protein